MTWPYVPKAYAGLSGDRYSPPPLSQFEDYIWNASPQQAKRFIDNMAGENVVFIVMKKELTEAEKWDNCDRSMEGDV